MKKIIFLTAILLIAMSFSFTANAFWWDNHGHKGEGEHSGRKHHSEWNHDVRECPNPVSAPLDGGILSILGAAGLAYYVSRKKKAA